MKNYVWLAAFVTVVVTLVGCTKKNDAPSSPLLTPSETVMQVSQALTRRDSTAFLNLLTDARRKAFQANPMLLRRTLAYWSAHHPAVNVISEREQGGEALVTFRLRYVTTHLVDTTMTMELIKENGTWKYLR